MSTAPPNSAPRLEQELRHELGCYRAAERVGLVRCDELAHVAQEARRSDDASFLAGHPGPCFLLIGPDRTNVRSGIVVPFGYAPSLKTLGRHPENDIVAPWPSISRRHAMILVGEDGSFLVDRGSANGTFLGMERLLPDVPRPLRDGDEVVFGSDLHAVYLTSRGLLAAVRRINGAAA